MLPPERPELIRVALDDHRLVVDAGLILPVTLAHRQGSCGHHIKRLDALMRTPLPPPVIANAAWQSRDGNRASISNGIATSLRSSR